MGTTGTFGTGAVAIESGAFVDFNRSNSYTCSNVISGAGKVRNIGAGPVILTGANTYTGGTDIVAGTLGFASGGLGSSGSITFTAGATLRWYSGNTQDVSSRIVLADGTDTIEIDNGNVTFATALSDADVDLVKTGQGRLILGGPSTVLDSLTITAGTLCIGDGDIGLTFTATDGIAIASGATLEVNESSSLTISASITGTGAVKIASSGTVILNGGANTYTGQTEVYSGTLAVGSNLASDIVVRNGGVLTTQADTTDVDVGDISFDSGGDLHFKIDAGVPTAGIIRAGAVAITSGATASFTVPTGNFTIGLVAPLLEYSSLTGGFTGFLNGATFSTGASSPFATQWQAVYNYAASNTMVLLAIA